MRAIKPSLVARHEFSRCRSPVPFRRTLPVCRCVKGGETRRSDGIVCQVLPNDWGVTGARLAPFYRCGTTWTDWVRLFDQPRGWTVDHEKCGVPLSGRREGALEGWGEPRLLGSLLYGDSKCQASCQIESAAAEIQRCGVASDLLAIRGSTCWHEHGESRKAMLRVSIWVSVLSLEDRRKSVTVLSPTE